MDGENGGRYDRQIPLIGPEGQARLDDATVFIAGAGGLGSAVAYYCAAAGIGRIRIADCDIVECTNLNRQILHWERDIGRTKADSAREKLHGQNPGIAVETFARIIDAPGIDDLLDGAELIVDALDNYATRFLLNEAALERGIPLVHGAVHGFSGQAMTVVPGTSACLRCVIQRAPPAIATPVMGAACGVIGSIQAIEAVKCITGRGELLTNRMLIWDGLAGRLDELRIDRDIRCPACGSGEGR